MFPGALASLFRSGGGPTLKILLNRPFMFFIKVKYPSIIGFPIVIPLREIARKCSRIARNKLQGPHLRTIVKSTCVGSLPSNHLFYKER